MADCSCGGNCPNCECQQVVQLRRWVPARSVPRSDVPTRLVHVRDNLYRIEAAVLVPLRKEM